MSYDTLRQFLVESYFFCLCLRHESLLSYLLLKNSYLLRVIRSHNRLATLPTRCEVENIQPTSRRIKTSASWSQLYAVSYWTIQKTGKREFYYSWTNLLHPNSTRADIELSRRRSEKEMDCSGTILDEGKWVVSPSFRQQDGIHQMGRHDRWTRQRIRDLNPRYHYGGCNIFCDIFETNVHGWHDLDNVTNSSVW